MHLSAAVRHVDRHGALLVYPLDNRTDPPSLWHAFFPRSRMRWDWDAGADDRVVDLWHLRARLATSRKVVYMKWFRGRATLISRPLFTAMLAVFRAQPGFAAGLDDEARAILEQLEADSPMSSRVLRVRADLAGRMHEAAWQRASKSLFERLAIVGFGEVDDGAFPSLAMGATQSLFEDLWDESSVCTLSVAERRIERTLVEGSPFRRQYHRVRQTLIRAAAALPSAPRFDHDHEAWMYGVHPASSRG
jgi:hypothetical protein